MDKRVAVTGLGVVSCIGNDVKTFWNNLTEGVCGIDYITEYAPEQLIVKIGGKVRNFDPLQHGLDKAFVRKQDPFVIFAAAAAHDAILDSGLKAGENIDEFRFSTYVGSGTGGFQTIQAACDAMHEEASGRWVSPLFIPNMIGNMAGGQIAILNGAKGSCIDIVTACATSTHAIGEAFRAIKHGYADAVITGGSDHCTIPVGLAGFHNAKALTKAEDPKYASLPFNLNRAGFVCADGAAIIILEEWEHAISRGAHIYAEMVGYGTSCDAFHPTAPRPDGTTQARCIEDALKEAGFNADKDTMYINAHGTGTHLNDIAETNAYKIVLGDYAYKAHISSTKSMHGHMLGATGAAEAIATVLAIQEGIIPPTINLDTPDPECDLDYTPNAAVRETLSIGISDSFGFGGHNACIAFRPAK